MNIHPFLFALFPIFFLAAQNADEVLFSDTVPWILASLIMTAGIMLIFWLATRERKKAALMSSLFLILFFSYGHIAGISEEPWIRHRYLFGLWALIFSIGVAAIIKARISFRILTDMLNGAACLLVLFSTLFLAAAHVREVDLSPEPPKTPQKIVDITKGRNPDIYYFLLDGYAHSQTLKELYGYDNSPFIDYLSKKGFYVVAESRSNYSATRFSLPSILHMDYAEHVIPASMLSPETYNPRTLVQNHPVGRFLQENGYTYIHAGAQWDWTSHIAFADVNINKRTVSDFALMLYKSTALYPVSFRYDFFDPRREQWKRILFQFDKLAKISARKEATFVFAHIGIPHPPFVFTPDGAFLKTNEEGQIEKRSHFLAHYPDQIAFLNKKLEILIDDIIAGSDIPPVIVLQSDHGSRIPPDVKTFEQIDDAYVRDRLRNFSALYLPEGETNLFNEEIVPYKTMTPVNTFRLIFNRYFGTAYPFLPDKSYLIVSWDKYKPIDVTDQAQF